MYHFHSSSLVHLLFAFSFVISPIISCLLKFTTKLCFPGMRRTPKCAHFEAVAADPKRTTFQQLQGYITTRLKCFSNRDKMLFSRLSNENITISAFSLERHQRATAPNSAYFADAEHFFFSTPAVRSWKSLSNEELCQELTSLLID